MRAPVLLLLATTLATHGERDFSPRTVIKKAFPAITDAPVVAASKVTDEIVRDDELVIGVVHNDKARAYPVNQLTGPRREIINDKLGGGPIAATW
jgi:hypothetical protein